MALARMQCGTGTVMVKVCAAFAPLASILFFLSNWSEHPEHDRSQFSLPLYANEINELTSTRMRRGKAQRESPIAHA